MNFPNTVFKTTTLLLGFLFLSACSSGGSDNEETSTKVNYDAKAIIDNLADNVITDTYTELNDAAVALLSAITALDSNTSDPEMMTAQDAWKSARKPWESSEGFLFGPVDSLGIDPAIDSWPLNTPDLTSFLATNPDQVAVESASDDLRGFHAIEYLLFGDGVSDNQKSAAEMTSDEAGYLVALAQAFNAQTTLLADSWTTDFNGLGSYAEILKTQGSGQTFSSQGAVIETLVTGIAGIADEVANAKIAEPFSTSASNADTSKVESQYSWNSLTDFSDNIQSILNIYTGKKGYNWQVDSIDPSMNGLYAFVNAHDSTLALSVLDEIIAAQQSIALVKGDSDNTTTAITAVSFPFRTQISDSAGRVLIENAINAVNTLFNTLDIEVLALIGETDFAN